VLRLQRTVNGDWMVCSSSPTVCYACGGYNAVLRLQRTVSGDWMVCSSSPTVCYACGGYNAVLRLQRTASGGWMVFVLFFSSSQIDPAMMLPHSWMEV